MRSPTILALTAALFAVAAPASGAASLKPGANVVKGGTTVLTVDPGAQATFTKAQVTVSGFGAATSPGAWTYTLPITGGKLVYKAPKKGKGARKPRKSVLTGRLEHRGAGLTLAKPEGFAINMTDYREDFAGAGAGSLSGQPNVTPGRLEIGKLTDLKIRGTVITAKVMLTPAAVAQTTAGFATDFDKRGALLGTVVISPTI